MFVVSSLNKVLTLFVGVTFLHCFSITRCIKMVLRSSSILVIISILWGFSNTSTNPLDTSTFEIWKSKILDKTGICIAENNCLTAQHLDNKHHSVTLFRFVKDCKDKDARWDYQIQATKLGKHLNTSSAYVTVKVPRKGTTHLDKLSTGLKWNMCLKFGYGVPHEFSGRLVNGKMQGRVTVNFKDGIFIEGYAINSILQPCKRYLVENKEDGKKLLNFTAYSDHGKHIIVR